VRAAAVERVPAVRGADQRHLFFADAERGDPANREVVGRSDRGPGRLAVLLAAVGAGDGQRLVVHEAGVPVAAVAERLVARVAAAAQREVLAAGAVAAVRTLQRNAAAHLVGAVAGDVYLRTVVVGGLGLAAFDVAQGARRTLAHGLDDRVPVGAVRVDPGLQRRAPHRRQAARAEAGVRAGAAVVQDRDLLAFVGVQPVRHALVRLGVVEADGDVGAVAERFVLRGAAAAQDHARLGRDALAAGIVEIGEAADLDRAVVHEADDRGCPDVLATAVGHATLRCRARAAANLGERRPLSIARPSPVSRGLALATTYTRLSS